MAEMARTLSFQLIFFPALPGSSLLLLPSIVKTHPQLISEWICSRQQGEKVQAVDREQWEPALD